jgi:sarcosine oxidase subunit gamma
MADPLHGPLLARTPPVLAASELLQPLGPATRFILRGNEETRAAAARGFGVDLPVQPCRAVSTDERAALWLGPDEWLLIAAESDPCSTLWQGLEGTAHSLVDVSHRQSAFCVSGPAAATLLAAGCPLDLDPAAFPVGMCTRTVCAKTEIVLWRPAPQTFRVEVWRSFAAYLTQFLAQAARGMI